ncbi:MAG: serine/threonine-protein kinase [Myxococcota bacterium]
MTATHTQHFGEYELVERLGVGGMAETFVAIRRGPAGFSQRVCLKRILATFRDEPEFVALFMREARLSALLHHNHIARVLDFGAVDGNHYLTIELIEGTDLRSLLAALANRGERLELNLVVYLARALAAALDFAHTADDAGVPAGLVHRDVSPSNVLLSYAGEVKLADFGIAKRLDQPGSLESTALKGKVPYMAPEYAVGLRYDARSDLYSLGVVLYECLTGRRPYDGENDLETIERARQGVRDSMDSLGVRAPRSLVRAVESLIAPSPSDRPTNAGEFLQSLETLPANPLNRRQLGALVRDAADRGALPVPTGLASTRPAATPRRRKRRPSRN